MFFPEDTKIVSLSVQECLELLEQYPEIILLDVRRSDEYTESSIPGSMHLELAEILDGKWVSLLPYQETGLILQCKSGGRSMKAAQFLAGQGFKKLWNMAGGITAYQELKSQGLKI